MGDKNLSLYVGLDKRLTDLEIDTILHIVTERHPDAIQEEIFDGYWSGIEETTLHIKVVTTIRRLSGTARIVNSMYPDVFIAIDDSYN